MTSAKQEVKRRSREIKRHGYAGHLGRKYAGRKLVPGAKNPSLDEFVEMAGYEEIGPDFRILRDPVRKRTKFRTKAASPGSGLAWLKVHVDFEGDDCLLYPFRTTASPRGAVTYNFKSMPAHRAMCFLAHRSPPEGKDMALHSCGNGHLGCVNPKHLYWGDQSDNNRDAQRHMREGKPTPSAA